MKGKTMREEFSDIDRKEREEMNKNLYWENSKPMTDEQFEAVKRVISIVIAYHPQVKDADKLLGAYYLECERRAVEQFIAKLEESYRDTFGESWIGISEKEWIAFKNSYSQEAFSTKLFPIEHVDRVQEGDKRSSNLKVVHEEKKL